MISNTRYETQGSKYETDLLARVAWAHQYHFNFDWFLPRSMTALDIWPLTEPKKKKGKKPEAKIIKLSGLDYRDCFDSCDCQAKQIICEKKSFLETKPILSQWKIMLRLQIWHFVYQTGSKDVQTRPINTFNLGELCILMPSVTAVHPRNSMLRIKSVSELLGRAPTAPTMLFCND